MGILRDIGVLTQLVEFEIHVARLRALGDPWSRPTQELDQLMPHELPSGTVWLRRTRDALQPNVLEATQ